MYAIKIDYKHHTYVSCEFDSLIEWLILSCFAIPIGIVYFYFFNNVCVLWLVCDFFFSVSESVTALVAALCTARGK